MEGIVKASFGSGREAFFSGTAQGALAATRSLPPPWTSRYPTNIALQQMRETPPG